MSHVLPHLSPYLCIPASLYHCKTQTKCHMVIPYLGCGAAAIKPSILAHQPINRELMAFRGREANKVLLIIEFNFAPKKGVQDTWLEFSLFTVSSPPASHCQAAENSPPTACFGIPEPN